MSDPFLEIRRVLNGADARDEAIRIGSEGTPRLRLDSGRERRTGVPEIVLAERKTTEDVARSLIHLARTNGRALASRVRDDHLDGLSPLMPDGHELTMDREARIAILVRDGASPPDSGGRVALICAGASDRPVANEARIMVEEMGCSVMMVADVGVAGLHRLVQPLRAVMDAEVDAVIVAAGMDGALPSVVAGLIDVPVIGLPVSVGYGYGGDGTGALMSMLQSCSPGIAVVNIDNGIGAGAMAGLIANRAAGARSDRASGVGAEAPGSDDPDSLRQ